MHRLADNNRPDHVMFTLTAKWVQLPVHLIMLEHQPKKPYLSCEKTKQYLQALEDAS